MEGYEVELNEEVVRLITREASGIAIEIFQKLVQSNRDSERERKIADVRGFAEKYRIARQGIYKKMRNEIELQSSADYTFNMYMKMMSNKPFKWFDDIEANNRERLTRNVYDMVVFENAVQGLTEYYDLIDDAEGKRRMRVFNRYFMEDEKVSMREIEADECCDKRTLYRDLDRAVEEIATAMLVI